MAQQAMGYVKSVILQGLSDKDQMIRQTVSSVINALIASDEPGAWPEALDTITSGVGSQDINVQEVSQQVMLLSKGGVTLPVYPHGELTNCD